jgi:hypothetical protein
MKSLNNFLAIVLLLFLFSCSNDSTSDLSHTTTKVDSIATFVEKTMPIIEKNDESETITISEFGISYEVPASLNILQKNFQFATSLTAKGLKNEPNELLIITPTVETAETFSTQMQNEGLEVSNENNNLVVNAPNNNLGIEMKSIYISSPNEGGILVIYILKNGIEPKINESEINELVNSIKYTEPTWTISDRIAFYQQLQTQQQQLSDQEKLAKLRRDHQQNQLDMLGLQVDGLIGR